MSKLLDTLLQTVRPAVLDRRSVLLLLEEEWHLRRVGYWSRLFRAMEHSIAGLSRIPFAESLTRLATQADDLLPLIDAVFDPRHGTAMRAYRFVCQFATAMPEVVTPDPWLRLCLDAGRSEVPEVLAVAAQLVYRIVERRKLPPVLRSKAATAARVLLSTAWSQGLGPMALGAVIDTLDAAPVEGTGALHSLLDSAVGHPHREEMMRQLARHIQELLVAPDIVARLYMDVIASEANEEARQKREFFSWDAAAQAARRDAGEVPRVPSRLRTHDQGVHYWLERHVEMFLERAPLTSVRAYVEAAAYWESATDVRAKRLPTVTLASAHGSFAIVARPSEGQRGHPMSLIEHVLTALGPAIDAFPSSVREEVLNLLRGMPAPPSVWAALIQHAEMSEILRSEILPMLTNPSALQMFAKPVADLIRSLGDRIPPSLRGAMSATVELLRDDEGGHDRVRLETALRATAATSMNESSSSEGGTLSSDDEDEYVEAIVDAADPDEALDMARLRMSREELRQPANAVVREVTKAAWRDIMRLEQVRQKREDAVDILRDAIVSLGVLRVALQQTNLSPPVEAAGWTAFARLASLRVLLSDSSDGDADVYAAAARTDGPTNPRGDLLNAGQAFPRAEAVVGLISLAVREERALTELERLAADSEPAVRYQIAWRLGALSKIGRDRAWPLLVRLVGDADVNVAAAAVSELNAFYRLDQAAALDLAVDALVRFSGSTEAEHEGRTDALLQLVWYHLARANSVAGEAVSRVVAEIATRPVGIDRLMHSYRDWLVMTSDDGAEEAIRLRTVDLFNRIGRACVASLLVGPQTRFNVREGGADDARIQLVEEVASQLYFASGAFRAEESATPLSDDVLSRFYLEMRDLLVELGTCGVVAASNRVLETLEYLTGRPTGGIDKRDALQRFLRVGENAVRAGAADAHWLLNPIENVIRRSVAEGETALMDDVTLVAWSRILDPLIDLGWEQAYRLARDFDLSR